MSCVSLACCGSGDIDGCKPEVVAMRHAASMCCEIALSDGLLRPVMRICSKWPHCAGNALSRSRRYRLRFNWWPLLQCPKQRDVRCLMFQSDEPMESAKLLHPPLLAATEHLHWQGWKMAKQPKQIYPLTERRLYISRTKRGQYAQHAPREFLQPHEHHLNLREFFIVLLEQFKGQNYCTKSDANRSRNSEIPRKFRCQPPGHPGGCFQNGNTIGARPRRRALCWRSESTDQTGNQNTGTRLCFF
jgi:hypothetical protein